MTILELLFLSNCIRYQVKRSVATLLYFCFACPRLVQCFSKKYWKTRILSGVMKVLLIFFDKLVSA